MIILRAWRVVQNRAGKPILVHASYISKWKNNHDFGFDIFDVKNWARFLQTYRVNNKLLPSVSKDGDPIRYEVYVWGSSSWMREFMVVGKHPFGFYSLFPSYDKNSQKRSLVKYGVIKR